MLNNEYYKAVFWLRNIVNLIIIRVLNDCELFVTGVANRFLYIFINRMIQENNDTGWNKVFMTHDEHLYE